MKNKTKFGIGMAVYILSDCKKVSHVGRIVGFWTESTDNVCAIVELIEGFYSEDKSTFISKMVVNTDNLR